MTNKPMLSVELRKALADFIEYSVPGPYGIDEKWYSDKQALRALLDKPEIRLRKVGITPLSGRYYLAECKRCGWVGSSEECTDECLCLQSIGDDCCYGETDEIGADRLLELVQAWEFDKPAAQQQGEPVAKLGVHHVLGAIHSVPGFPGVKGNHIHDLTALLNGALNGIEKPAPVAVVMPELESYFESWWESDGQYCRAGGGSYEKTFAYRACEAALSEVARLNGMKPTAEGEGHCDGE